MSPLDRQTGSQMSDCGLSSVVWGLWLWNIDNCAGHAANEDHASRRLSLHQMSRYRGCKQICTVHIDTPKLSDTVNWVVDSFEVLCKTCRRYKIVNLAVYFKDLRNGGIDGFWG
jgi:hypothetical protein